MSVARTSFGARAGLMTVLCLAAAGAAAVPLSARRQVASPNQPEGRVTDRASGAPVAGATVALWPPHPGEAGDLAEEAIRRAVTDERGAFAAEDAWDPGGIVEVSALGYTTLTLTWSEAAAASWRFELARDPLALDEVVVTASVRARRRSEIALPMESVEATEIAAAGAPSADRLLAELPGIQVAAGAPVGADLLIRGMGGPRVLVLLDGQPVTGALIENRDLSRLSLAGIDRVEIVKGPLSSLYGSDALGGVINVISRPPTAGFRMDARAASAGAGRREAEVTTSGGGRLLYHLTGGWRQEDRVPGVVDGDNAFARVWDLRSRLRFEVAEGWEARAGLTFLRERQRWPVGGGFSGFNDNRGLSGWIETEWRAASGTWSATLFGHDYEHLYRSARGDAPIAGGRDAAQSERLARATVGYSGTLGGHDFDVGVEGAERAIRSPDKLVEDRANDDQVALFAQDAWRLGGATLNVGTRLTRNSRWGSNLAPSLGLTGAVGGRLRLRAALARGFRAPSFKELGWNFSNLSGGYVIQGYADLEPEHSWSLSGGVEWQPGARLLINAEAYSNRVANLIESGFVGTAPSGLLVLSPRNVAEAVTQGVEVGVRVSWRRGEFSAGYAYLDAREAESGNPLDRRARHSARARATWAAEGGSGPRLDATAHFTGALPSS